MSNKKVALVGFRLNKGGSERVMAHLSNYFDAQGVQVHVVIFHDDIGYEFSGELFNLGKFKSNGNTIINKIKRFTVFYKYMKSNNFDFIIDFRFRINFIQEYLISKFIYKSKSIYTVHSSRINEYIPKSKFLAKNIYRRSYAVVSINKVMEELVLSSYGLNNGCAIYNPIDVRLINSKKDDTISFKGRFIIGIGEFETNIKQFDLLIKAYASSELPKKGVALFILGEGKQREHLLQITKECKVETMVYLLGYKNNPYKYLSKADFFVLSSKIEGFPMVLLEALACGIPVVSFDCLTGPREIIQDKVNGLLIENQNIHKLIVGMNEMHLNTGLYESCKNNSVKSIDKFSLDRIGEEWMKLMKLK